MIRPNLIHIKELKEFYKEIKLLQENAHGKEYTKHHDAIIQYVNNCKIIKELGVCQGATFAAMLLQHPKKLIGMDINANFFLPYQPLFDNYAKLNKLDYEYINASSIDENFIHEVDLLHIDSLHTPSHLMQELKIHAPHVNNYIIFHDTANYGKVKGLLPVIAKYITEEDQNWQIIEHYIHRVGYVVIERVNRIKM